MNQVTNQVSIAEDIKEIATHEVVIVGGDTYQWTLIKVVEPKAPKRAKYIKLNRDKHRFYTLEFIEMEKPSRLSGVYTTKEMAFSALRDWAKAEGLYLSIQHISTSGKVRDVNPEAV
ncbi:hypothetical protein ACSBOB_19285 [Mesorhizobium sp. ASY16-5R]|uniref:hypothetical protein n=1 Tax=Mesorhizobium sp. ASY16-5R TaxID=3445772 RepID=UPI003FA033C4